MLSTQATNGKKFTVAQVGDAMGALGLCNIDMADDRSSYRMRYMAAASLALLERRQSKLRVTGASLTHACAFATIKGGMGMGRLRKTCCVPTMTHWSGVHLAADGDDPLDGIGF